MRRALIITWTLAVVLTIGPAAARAELDVVATVPDLAAIAKEVGGSSVNVTALALPTQDPHWVDAKPSLILPLNRAELLVAVGAELEQGWLPTLQVGARNRAITSGGKGYLQCSDHVHLLEIPGANLSRAMGDIHPSGNPHYLYDPRKAAACAQAIAARMAELDPANAETYRANARAFVARLDARRAQWEKKLASFRGAPVVTYHQSWVYLTDWLGLKVVERIEPKPGVQPTPRHIAQVIRTARLQKARVVLQETYYPSRTAKLVAAKAGMALVDLPAGTDFVGGQSYLEHMDELIERLARGLAGGRG